MTYARQNIPFSKKFLAAIIYMIFLVPAAFLLFKMINEALFACLSLILIAIMTNFIIKIVASYEISFRRTQDPELTKFKNFVVGSMILATLLGLAFSFKCFFL